MTSGVCDAPPPLSINLSILALVTTAQLALQREGMDIGDCGWVGVGVGVHGVCVCVTGTVSGGRSGTRCYKTRRRSQRSSDLSSAQVRRSLTQRCALWSALSGSSSSSSCCACASSRETPDTSRWVHHNFGSWLFFFFFLILLLLLFNFCFFVCRTTRSQKMNYIQFSTRNSREKYLRSWCTADLYVSQVISRIMQWDVIVVQLLFMSHYLHCIIKFNKLYWHNRWSSWT